MLRNFVGVGGEIRLTSYLSVIRILVNGLYFVGSCFSGLNGSLRGLASELAVTGGCLMFFWRSEL